ncbi:MAG: amino acid adenylation domain-containing protein, partial [Cyanobacteria bacterium P01_H01_bin.15]
MAEIQDLYELSSTQQGLLFHTLYAPSSGIYFEQRHCLLTGELNRKAFREAWQQVVNRHTVLRSEFHWQETDQPLQIVYDAVELPWIEADWRNLDKAEQDAKLNDFLIQDRTQGFALDQAPLMRCALFRLDAKSYRFVWSYHHLLMDGWCNGILLKEMLTIYQSLRQGSRLTLPPAPLYRDYILWLQNQESFSSETFWRKALAGLSSPTLLPIIQNVSEQKSPEIKEQILKLSAEKIQDWAKTARLTLNTIFQGAWALLLSRYSTQDDVLFGITVSGRPTTLSNAESMVGLFINTVPLRSQISATQELLPWLQDLQQTQRDRECFGFNSLTDIQRWSELPTGTGLFDSLLVFENYPVSIESATNSPELGIQLQDAQGYEQTNYPLTLVIIPGEEIALSLRYNAQRVTDETAQRLLAHLNQIVNSFVADKAQTLGEIEICTSTESTQLKAWGKGPVFDISSFPVHAQFEAQADKNPDAIAITFTTGTEVTELSYQALNSRANQLAHYLRAQGIKSGSTVGICLDRSIEMVAALLAVLKAGATYIPLDPSYPAPRIAQIVDDSELELLIVQGNLAITAKKDLSHLDLAEAALEIEQQSSVNLSVKTDPEDLAYIIYTSGSTGKPKGVPIQHRSLTNFLAAIVKRPGLQPNDRMLAVTTIAFDIAALELFAPLVTGAEVILTPRELVQDGERLASLIDNFDVSIMQATPATWRLLLDIGWLGKDDLAILCGGEALDLELANALLPRCYELWNLYGPTETTIWSAVLKITPDLLAHKTVPIGQPLDNTTLAVLDEKQHPLPVGIPGELYIGGAGLSPGYLNLPELTAARFVCARNYPDGTAKLYKTGDLVCYRGDGNLDYLGRLDNQIKLRGFRIEPNEIEAALLQHPAVTQSVVVLNASDQLIAYVVAPKVDAKALGSELRTQMKASLPGYMVPATYIVLERLPLTPNGKVDRNALPTADRSSPSQLETPDTPIAEIVAGIWVKVLNCESVNLQDHFFELGGHSLLATRVIAQIRQVLGREVSLRSLFEQPILADFVTVIQTEPALPPIRPASKLVLSSAQRRQWLIAKLEPESSAYVICAPIRLRGPLSATQLESSLKQVVARHETLRSHFAESNGEPVPVVTPADQAVKEIELIALDLSKFDKNTQRQQIKKRIQRQQRPFDLAVGPLWRAQLLKLNDDEHVLIFALHHIITDGWSLGLMLKELSNLYQGDELPPLPVSYTDYAAWQNELDLDIQKAYWQQQLQDAPPLLELPTDFPRPAKPTGQGGKYQLRLTKAQTDALKQLGQVQGTTLFMTLLAAFKVLLYRYSGVTDLLIGTPIANRQRAEVEPLMGMFINTLVLRSNLAGNPTFSELLAQVRQVALDAYSHQDLPFEQLLDSLDLPRSASHSPLFQVMFALQNAHREAAESVDGLSWSPLPVETSTAKYALLLEMQETAAGNLIGSIEYRRDLFTAETIHRMAAHLRNLLLKLPNQPELRLSSLSMLMRKEAKQLQTWSTPRATARKVPNSIIQLFEAQVAATPDAIAVSLNDESLSYLALNQRANQLAHYLRSQNRSFDTPIAIWADRTVNTIVAILAILKAGSAYVPLDPNYPKERLRLLIQDTQVSQLIQPSGNPIPDLAVSVTALDGIALVLETLPIDNLNLDISPESLAYILFTSGSTGQPKGVCVPHRGIVRLAKNPHYIAVNEDDRILQSASLSFDASTYEIWGALLNGAELVLLPMQAPALSELGQIICDKQISVLWLTAGLFNLMVEEELVSLRSLRLLIAGGDKLAPSYVREAQAGLPTTQIVNGYGPTENTTFSCCYPIEKQDEIISVPPIGYPILDTQVYVLDPDLAQVPVGIPGELYLGGAGLARGYLNRPALTAERFIPNPFYDVRQPGSEQFYLYRTGDRVRFTAEGKLEFLGRTDHQVKIRGFRVEPGEIEAALSTHPNVQKVVVRVDGIESGEKRLMAYLQQASCEVPFVSTEYRNYLRDYLPDYLIPAKFICMEKFPLMVNGKIDRSALPKPEWDADDEALPRNELETALAEIWSVVLRVESVGVHTNFFDLGGDSILALQIVSRAAQAGLKIPPQALFQHQTIAALATIATPVETIAISQEPATGRVPLTPIQHWFFTQNLARPHYFNQSVCLALPPNYDRNALNAAIEAIYRHHDILRLRFGQGAEGWLSAYGSDLSLTVPWIDLS